MSNHSNGKVGFRRSRYAARACKECKRRKVKCNGENPCLHCDRYDVQCEYALKKMSGDAEQSLDVKVIKKTLGMLQQQVDLLVSRDALSQQVERNQPSATNRLPLFPSLSPDSHSLAPKTAEQPDIRSFSHGTGDIPDTLSAAHSSASARPTPKLAVACHPLLSISQAEAMRLIDIYEDECGSVYPLIDIGHLRHFAVKFYDEVNTSRKPATWRTFQVDQPSKEPFNILEIVLAIGLVIEDRGSTDLGSALVDELEAEVDHRPSGVSVDIPFAEILTLMSLYHFYRDEDVLAWRTIGLAARIALELGFHLRDPPFTVFQSTQERERANRLFWCIYCLDKRWSFGTGLPFAIQEGDIDPSLPEPNDLHPYLFTSMIAYSKIGSEILRALSGVSHLRQVASREDTAFLTYQVEQWYNSLASELRIEPGQEFALATLSPARNRLRVLHYLRKNQLRMLIHRESLFTVTSITADPRGAKTAVDLAKDTITLLEKLRTTSEIYSSHPVCFNYFLYSALIVILLAAYRAKAQFHEYCREEFHMALNLVGGIPAKSSVARKLWKIIKHLKVVGPETGILPYLETQQDKSRPQPDVNCTVQLFDGTTQMSLDTHAVKSFPPYGEAGFFTGEHVVDETLLSSELSDLFQAIDPVGIGLIPDQPSTIQAGRSFSRNVWNVL